MKLNHLLAASAALALTAGVAYAQTPPADEGKDQPPAAASSTSTEATTPAPSVSDQAVTSSTTASATVAGTDASVTTRLVTNGPVPDTKENRARYGQPLSNAGRRTAAKGN